MFIWLTLAALLISLLLLSQLLAFLRKAGCNRENYRGNQVIFGSGLLFILVFVGSLALAALIPAFQGPLLASLDIVFPLLLLVGAATLFGFLDDLLGDSSARGFVGHFSQLFRGNMTTGALKALGCAAVAALAVLPFSPNLPHLVLSALVVALAINSFNLLDLRPGRSLKVYVVAVLLILIFGGPNELRGFWGLLLAPALVLLPSDLKERAMLGDAGSNVLGAIAGFGLVLTLGWQYELGLLAALVALNLFGDRRSLSEVIAGSAILSRLDGLGRGRRKARAEVSEA